MNNPPKILIFGTGFVAQAYARALYYLGFYPQMVSRSWCDYSKQREVRMLLASSGMTHVINASGFTGRTVDDCENSEESLQANHIIPVMLAGEAVRQSASFIHISTGCLFMGGSMGEGPFTEEDTPNFMDNSYQQDKRDAELHMPAGAWIFRIRMPFSQFPHPRNWLCKLKAYPKIINGRNSVTWIDEFALRSWQLVNKASPGIYHAAQRNPVSTMAVAKLLGSGKELLQGSELDEFHKVHVRRSEAVLDCSKFETTYGAKFTDSMSAITYCIANLGKGWNFDPNATLSPASYTESTNEGTPPRVRYRQQVVKWLVRKAAPEAAKKVHRLFSHHL